jgi:hypothetical protein
MKKMPKRKRFTVQIEGRMVVSRTILADDMEEAVLITARLANEQPQVRPAKGWSQEYEVESEVMGVFK